MFRLRAMLRDRLVLCGSLLALTSMLASACGGTPPESAQLAEPPADSPADVGGTPDPTQEPSDTAGELVAEGAEPEPEPEVDPWGPIDPGERAIMLAGEEGPRISTPEHYIKTNERRHDVWFPYIADTGGVYVGVAADQNYTLIGVAKSEYVFLMDLDWRVTELHRAYEVLIEASEDPVTLHERFHERNAEASAKLIEEALEGEVSPEILRKTMMSWRSARETIYRHLKHVIARTQGGENTSWLSNPEYYAHIRKLYLNDRVRMLVGDLTGPTGFQTVAKAAADLGVPVKLLYLSNAEEYYDYTAQYRTNVKALSIDEGSIVLRTIYSKDWVHADSLWNYQVQPLADYQTRLGDEKNGRRNRMLQYAGKEGVLERNLETVSGLSRINITMLPGYGDDAPAPAEEGDATAAE